MCIPNLLLGLWRIAKSSLCIYVGRFRESELASESRTFFPSKTKATNKVLSTRLSPTPLTLSHHPLHPSAPALSPYPLHPLLDSRLPHLRTHLPSPTHDPIYRTTMRDVRKAAFRETPLATYCRPGNTKSPLPLHSPQNNRRSNGREPSCCGERNRSQPY